MAERHLMGDGEIFRKGDESALCRCAYDLTLTTDEGPQIIETRMGAATLKGGGYPEIDGTVTPARPTTMAELRAAADKAGYLQLRLEDQDGWLDVQFTESSGNQVRGTNGPRAQR